MLALRLLCLDRLEAEDVAGAEVGDDLGEEGAEEGRWGQVGGVDDQATLEPGGVVVGEEGGADRLHLVGLDERIGLTVPAGDLELATAALVRIAAGTDEVQAMRRRLQAIAPDWTWKSIASPLIDFVARPRRLAPPLLDQRESRTFDGRQDPPPGSLKRLVPTPIRKHVLGPVKRRVGGSLDGQATRSTT